MDEERLDELLWQEIDGRIATDDRQRLRAFLAEDGAARERQREIVALAAGLDAVAELEPPSELRGRIRTALAERRQSLPRGGRRATPVRSWLGVLIGRLLPAPASNLGWAAAGLLLGVLGYHQLAGTLPSAPVDPDAFVGTLGVRPSAGARIVEIPDLDATARLWRLPPSIPPRGRWRVGEGLVVELFLAADAAAEVRLKAPGLQLAGAALTGPPTGRFDSADGEVVFETSGRGRYSAVAVVDDPAVLISISVTSEGQSVAQWQTSLDALPSARD